MSTQNVNTNRMLMGFLWAALGLGLVALLVVGFVRGLPQNDNQSPGSAQGGNVATATVPIVRTTPTVEIPPTAAAVLTPTSSPIVDVAPATAEVATPPPVDITPGPIITPDELPPGPVLSTPTAEPQADTPVPLPPQLQPSPTVDTPLPRGGKPKPTSTPTPVPTATPRPAGVAFLPNGVRYGDRTPNLPKRIVRITSPNIRLDTTVYEVYAPKGKWEVADYAAGHHYNSLNPGEGGNIVVAGHNNYRGEVFRYLEKLVPGNEIWVTTQGGKKHKYKVEEIKKLKQAGVSRAQSIENGKVMSPTSHEQLTLITCWPYTTYTHRLIVIAKPLP